MMLILTSLKIDALHVTLTASTDRTCADLAHATAYELVDSFAEHFALGADIGQDLDGVS